MKGRRASRSHRHRIDRFVRQAFSAQIPFLIARTVMMHYKLPVNEERAGFAISFCEIAME